MKIKNYKLKIIIGVTFCYLLFASTSAFSAGLSFETDKRSFAQDEEFLVRVFLENSGEPVNAVEGKIIFPADLLEVKEIRDGNSVINFWVEKPNLGKGEVIFSGITPGGLSGPRQFLFSIVFRAIKSGKGIIRAAGLRILLNDGNGTSVKTETSNFQFSISQETSLITLPEMTKDTNPPEDFKPTIANDPNIFDGKYFLVFATQDKGSGIKRYEVREGWWGWYSTAESPYLLKDQSLNKKIFVKAIDKNGNERVVALAAQNPVSWYKQSEILGIILLLIILGVWFKRKWLNFAQK